MKKLISILLVLCLVFALVACNKDNGANDNQPANSGNGSQPANSGNSGNSNQPANSGNDNTQSGNQPAVSARDTLTVAFTQDRGTLDPIYAYAQDLGAALYVVYDQLWDFDSNGDKIWGLATDLEIIEPTLWHIKLREGVRSPMAIRLLRTTYSFHFGSGTTGKASLQHYPTSTLIKQELSMTTQLSLYGLNTVLNIPIELTP